MGEGESEQLDIIMEAKADENIFAELLEFANTIKTIEVGSVYMEEPLLIHFMPLRAGETPDVDISTNFSDMTDEEKVKYLLDLDAEKAWLMIDKANDSGEVEDKYILNRKHWEELAECFPDIRTRIVSKVTGTLQEALSNFLSG